jgi:alpha-tubulin suppressor-like RCC1 family protein
VSEELVVSVKEQPAWLSPSVLDVAVSYPSLEDPQVACALDAEGHAACWRYTGSSLTTARPFQHPFAGTHRWTDITMGPEHSCGVERDETVWCVGQNNEFELGVQEPRSSSDTLLKVPGVIGAKAVAVGLDHSCALLKNGSVVCWGSNQLGQCGAVDRHSGSTPTPFLRFVGDVAGS